MRQRARRGIGNGAQGGERHVCNPRGIRSEMRFHVHGRGTGRSVERRLAGNISKRRIDGGKGNGGNAKARRQAGRPAGMRRVVGAVLQHHAGCDPEIARLETRVEAAGNAETDETGSAWRQPSKVGSEASLITAPTNDGNTFTGRDRGLCLEPADDQNHCFLPKTTRIEDPTSVVRSAPPLEAAQSQGVPRRPGLPHLEVTCRPRPGGGCSASGCGSAPSPKAGRTSDSHGNEGRRPSESRSL